MSILTELFQKQLAAQRSHPEGEPLVALIPADREQEFYALTEAEVGANLYADIRRLGPRAAFAR